MTILCKRTKSAEDLFNAAVSKKIAFDGSEGL